MRVSGGNEAIFTFFPATKTYTYHPFFNSFLLRSTDFFILSSPFSIKPAGQAGGSTRVCEGEGVLTGNGCCSFTSSLSCPAPYALCPAPYALCPAPCTLCPAPCALRPVPYALRLMPCALCPVPCALRPVPCALRLMPCALCPVPCALRLMPSSHHTFYT